VIRAANSFEDAVEVCRLGRLMHAEGKFNHIPFDEDSVLRGAYGIAANPNDGCLFLAEDEDGIYGFMAAVTCPYFFSNQHKYAQEICFYIDQRKRGGMAAVRLIKALEEWATALGCLEVSASVQVGISDELAQALYRRLGYHKRGTALIKPLKQEA
jgi:GNAT superfamily N-acetyltransferase